MNARVGALFVCSVMILFMRVGFQQALATPA